MSDARFAFQHLPENLREIGRHFATIASAVPAVRDQSRILHSLTMVRNTAMQTEKSIARARRFLGK